MTATKSVETFATFSTLPPSPPFSIRRLELLRRTVRRDRLVPGDMSHHTTDQVSADSSDTSELVWRWSAAFVIWSNQPPPWPVADGTSYAKSTRFSSSTGGFAASATLPSSASFEPLTKRDVSGWPSMSATPPVARLLGSSFLTDALWSAAVPRSSGGCSNS